MKPDLSPIIEALLELTRDMRSLAQENRPLLAHVATQNQTSATNLLHYLALRGHDLRPLQEQLARLGLSSLGRIETHALSGVLTVTQLLATLSRRKLPALGKPPCQAPAGRRLLSRNTEALLGPAPASRQVRIMVTMPSTAASDYPLVRDLLRNGMNCMRINCAHDSEPAWSRMIHHLRQAEQETGLRCKIEMDLAGPKLRTGPLAPGPSVRKVRPQRDPFGRVIAPARLWLTPQSSPEPPPPGATASLPVPRRWLQSLSPPDTVRFTDTRGARRTLTIVASAGKNRWAECRNTAYFGPGVVLQATSSGLRAHVGALPPLPQSLSLRPGDTLILTRDLAPAPLTTPARIGVTLPELFSCVRPGEPIWLDDGRIGGVIRQVSADEVTVEIQHAKPTGSKLGAEKGINLPGTDLTIPTLTPDDLAILPFLARHADILGFSFVRSAEDVRLLQSHLAALDAPQLGILLKIETRQAFENLPALLLAALASPHVGVMIARGDLAIECGYQRLAEVQEEILWIAEAAHLPVVWATQVLETLVKTGTPSRSEITDAAMGVRAECVMLNKGPCILDGVRTLDNILERMQDHQLKKRSMLRKLGVAADFAAAP
jgi:pyruvate kinase